MVLGMRMAFMTTLVVGDWDSLGNEGRTRDHARDPNSGGPAYMGGGSQADGHEGARGLNSPSTSQKCGAPQKVNPLSVAAHR